MQYLHVLLLLWVSVGATHADSSWSPPCPGFLQLPMRLLNYTQEKLELKVFDRGSARCLMFLSNSLVVTNVTDDCSWSLLPVRDCGLFDGTLPPAEDQPNKTWTAVSSTGGESVVFTSPLGVDIVLSIHDNCQRASNGPAIAVTVFLILPLAIANALFAKTPKGRRRIFAVCALVIFLHCAMLWFSTSSGLFQVKGYRYFPDSVQCAQVGWYSGTSSHTGFGKDFMKAMNGVGNAVLALSIVAFLVLAVSVWWFYKADKDVPRKSVYAFGCSAFILLVVYVLAFARARHWLTNHPRLTLVAGFTSLQISVVSVTMVIGCLFWLFYPTSKPVTNTNKGALVDLEAAGYQSMRSFQNADDEEVKQ